MTTSGKGDILIVDDQPANLKVLRSMLTGHGYLVRAAINGELALRAARKTPPDLILLDVRMPDMDGYAVCERLKAGERTRDVPVIFVSALDETQDKVKAFTAGGVDYVTKPFQVEEVLARVETHLALWAMQKQLEEKNVQLEQGIVERERLIRELRDSLDQVRALSGLLPICASCKKIRDDKGYWQAVEGYIMEHSEAQFSHGICPDCARKLYPEFVDDD